MRFKGEVMKEQRIAKINRNLLDCHETLLIIFINVVIYILLNVMPDIAEEILLNPQMDMIIKRPWTLITVIFSHELHIHLLVNMGLFFFFGRAFESITSSKTLLLVYILSGFIGSLAIIPVAPIIGWNGPIAGASAAVFGVVAAYAMMRPNISILGGKAKIYAGLLFISNLILAILNPKISIGASAHAVGILIGLICGYYLKNKETLIS